MSYNGAWDEGPPGAEAEYAPVTDPWTGASLAPYPAAYDYSAYAPFAGPYTSNVAASAYYPPPQSVYCAAPTSQTDSRTYRARSPPRHRYSSGSRSPTPPRKIKKERRSSSSSDSGRSFRRKSIKIEKKSEDRSLASPVGKSSYRPLRRSVSRTSSHSPHRDEKLTDKIKVEKDISPHSRKCKDSSSKGYRRPSVSPPRSYKYTSRRDKRSRSSSDTPPRKLKEGSLTPPRSYARAHSSSSSRSCSPKPKKRPHTPSPPLRSSRSSRSSSRSRSNSRSRRKRHSRSRSRSQSRCRTETPERRRSRSRNRTRSTSGDRGGSTSRDGQWPRTKDRRRSMSEDKKRSRSNHSDSGSSGSRTPSEDDRRGQFTVSDRKRFWKLHRTRIEEKGVRARSPNRRPPGAVLVTSVDNIQYQEPPEVVGHNFDELLPSASDMLGQPSSSKSKGALPIKNDGSFLEMFKKMQEATKKVEEVKKPEIKKPLPFIGKRRGGRVLKTGLVKKAKAIDEQLVDNAPKDAWSLYMQEVKKYRETSCEEERKTRPLVK